MEIILKISNHIFCDIYIYMVNVRIVKKEAHKSYEADQSNLQNRLNFKNTIQSF